MALEYKQIRDFEDGIRAFKMVHVATYVIASFRYRVSENAKGRWQVNRVINSDGTSLSRATQENNPVQTSTPTENEVVNLNYS